MQPIVKYVIGLTKTYRATHEYMSSKQDTEAMIKDQTQDICPTISMMFWTMKIFRYTHSNNHKNDQV